MTFGEKIVACITVLENFKGEVDDYYIMNDSGNAIDKAIELLRVVDALLNRCVLVDADEWLYKLIEKED